MVCPASSSRSSRSAELERLVVKLQRCVGQNPFAQGIDVIVSGHSHVPKIANVDGLLYVNPGSAGRRRFRLPITLASLEVTPDGLKPIMHDLEVG
jgi:predicted phosphodiesterase